MQDMDEKESFPVEVMKEGASLGFAALYVKEKYGGMNLGRVDASVR
jgi:alkylation response protein AidB-like acyl-CoA dehydrogenase